MPPEDAMEKYIDIVTELYPTWAAGLTVVSLDPFVFHCILVLLYIYSLSVSFSLLAFFLSLDI